MVQLALPIYYRRGTNSRAYGANGLALPLTTTATTGNSTSLLIPKPFSSHDCRKSISFATSRTFRRGSNISWPRYLQHSSSSSDHSPTMLMFRLNPSGWHLNSYSEAIVYLVPGNLAQDSSEHLQRHPKRTVLVLILAPPSPSMYVRIETPNFISFSPLYTHHHLHPNLQWCFL